ncbi:hypothetical protein X753_30715 [Mesorhizobium sp. LNJC399B00]|nr:hypothetical protein X753_30715 [Mesorhizobium sp. LNJC399B00]ESY12553.1 hypothetical protein X751_30075 [Mesorhizobium sp. LNJC395A00]
MRLGGLLIEAFSRLVWRATNSKFARRVLVGLYSLGVHINCGALGIAVFCLWLAALELDEQPISDTRDLKFDPVDSITLLADSVGEDLPTPITSRSVDPVVGNSPWTFVKKECSAESRSASDTSTPLPRRSPD